MYLFLDIDGVLFHLGGIFYHRSFKEEAPPHQEISPESRALLEKLLDNYPDLKIVLSSSWRKSHSTEEIKIALGDKVFSRLVGLTPCLNLKRGEEIQAWMKENVSNWTPDQVIILDDDADMNPLMGCLFNTNAHCGFTALDFVRIENYLDSTPFSRKIIRCKKFLHFNFQNIYYQILRFPQRLKWRIEAKIKSFFK